MITYHLNRWYISDKGIIGELLRSDELMCFTLEPPFEEEDGAIPEGIYPLHWTKSPRLGHFTPRLAHVPNREGILIHAGNVIKDSHGCILVGNGWTMNNQRDIFLTQSRLAKIKVYEAIATDLSGDGHAEIVVARENA